MTTAVTKIVGSLTGDDYTTIQAAIDAVPTDLVTPDQQWTIQVRAGTYTEHLDIPAMTSDATRFLTLTCVPGDEHKMVEGAGVFVNPNWTSGIVGIVIVRDEFARVANLEVSEVLGTAQKNNDGIIWYGTSSGGDNRGTNLLIHGLAGGAYPYRGYNHATPLTLNNSVAYDYSAKPMTGINASDHINNCTFVRSLNFSATSNDGIINAMAVNCIAINHGGTGGHHDFLNLATGSTNNLSTDSSGDVINVDPTTIFKQFNANGFNLHLKAGSAAIGAGVGPSANSEVPAADIDGDARSGATTDIGADFYVAPSAPTFSGTIPNKTTVQGDPVSLDISTYFANANTYSVDSLPDGLGLDPNSGKITGNVSDTTGSPLSITLTASNDTGSVASNTFTWTLTTNQTPTLDTAIPDQSSNAATSVSLDVSGHFSDPDGSTLTFSDPSGSLPPNLTISAAGVVSGTLISTAPSASPYSATIRATDPGGLYVEGFFSWVVNAVAANNPPIFSGPIPDQVWSEGNAVSLDVSGYFDDSDGTIASYSATGLPSGISIDNNGLISGIVAFGASSNSPYSAVASATDNGGKTTAGDAFSVTAAPAAAKSFTVKLSSPTGGAVIGTPSQATVIIT